MPFLDLIVDYINESLKGSSLNDNRFTSGKLLGIASIVAKKNNSGELETLPAIENNGEFVTIEPDDRNGIIIYHRVNSNVYSTVPKSQGDGHDYRCLTEMAAIVIADEDLVKMKAERLEPLLVFGLPQRLSQAVMNKAGFRSCLITPVASDMDKLRVFRTEYPQSPYFLKPKHQLFILRYRIDATFNKDCIDACLCGE